MGRTLHRAWRQHEIIQLKPVIMLQQLAVVVMGTFLHIVFKVKLQNIGSEQVELLSKIPKLLYGKRWEWKDRAHSLSKQFTVGMVITKQIPSQFKDIDPQLQALLQ